MNKLLDSPVSNATVIVARLEEAGRTVLALPHTGYTTHLRTSSFDIVRTAAESYAGGGRVRPPVPSSAAITRMDEAFAWVLHIPRDRHVLRRIVGARSLVHPITDRHLFSWRRLAQLVGADHKAVQRWHEQGIALIAQALGAAASS